MLFKLNKTSFILIIHIYLFCCFNIINAQNFEFKNHYYKSVVHHRITWEEAKTVANYSGGYLATITDLDEQNFIESILSTNGTEEFWLGGYQTDPFAPPNEKWAWENGEEWSFTNWDSGEPNDFSGIEEKYLAIRSNGKWNDEGASPVSGYIIEFSSDDWVQKFPNTKPSAREAHAMSYISIGKMILFGGENGINGGHIGETWIYDISNNTWTQMNPDVEPIARYSHDMAYIGDEKVLLFGGINKTDGTCNDTWIYDYSDNSWNQKKPVIKPSVRSAHAMAYISRKKVLLFGGSDGQDETWIYDAIENKWTNKNPLSKPAGRSQHKLGYIGDDKVLLFGGWDGTSPFSDTWVYDLSENNWTRKNPLSKPSARYLHDMSYISNNKILLFGGNIHKSPNYNNETWVYDLDKNTWMKDSNTIQPSARDQHSLCRSTIDGSNYLVLFGGFTDGTRLDDTWTFGGADYLFLGDVTPPNPPQNLKALAGDNKVTLSWSANIEDDLKQYKIYRNQTQGFTPTMTDSIAVVFPPDTNYVDSDVVNGQTYYYRISAVDTAGNESEFSEEVSAIPILLTENKIIASDGDWDDRFGEAVTISGEYAIVGVKNDDQLKGSAYIFQRNNTIWYEQTKLIANDGNFGDKFGCSVAIDSHYAIVGARCNDNSRGSAYIFKGNGISWNQQAKLQPIENDTINNFGTSVSISGDYVIIGARHDATKTGAVYIFKRDSSKWEQIAKFTTKQSSEDNYGCSVSISDDYAIVGDYGDNENGWAAGAAYVYHRNGTEWEEESKIIASDGGYNDQFGYDVSISGNYILIGVYSASAYIFKHNGAYWKEQVKFLPNDLNNPTFFGSSVSISGDYAVVGDYRTGSIYAYLNEGDTWRLKDIHKNKDGNYDKYGYSVSISENYAIVGAPNHSTRYGQDGAAYIYHSIEDLLLFSVKDTIPPKYPINLQVSVKDLKVELSWMPNSENDLCYYKIYRNQNQGFTPITNDSIATVFPPDTSYLDRDVVNGQTYYYRISAVDTAGNESEFSEEVSATPQATILYPKISLSSNTIDFGNVRIGKTAQTSFSIYNTGEDTLEIFSIECSRQEFDISVGSAEIMPDDSLIVTVHFSPTATQTYRDTLTIISNDPDNSEEKVYLTGNGVAAPRPIINISQNTVSFGKVDIGDRSVKEFYVQNTGDTTLVISSFSVIDTVFKAQVNETEISPQDSQKVSIAFQPDSLKPENAELIIHCNDPDNPADTVRISGTGVDRIPPNIVSVNYNESMMLNETQSITATITDNYGIDAAQITYRNGNANSFQSVEMVSISEDEYEASIDASAITMNGIEFIITSEDYSQNRALSDTIHPAIQFPTNSLSSSSTGSAYKDGFPRGQWQMISVPATLNSSDVSAILSDESELGNYGEPNWRLFRWENEKYIEYNPQSPGGNTEFEPGYAFWLKANPDGEKIEIDVGSGMVLPLKPYKIKLNPGWNQIGNPFHFDIHYIPNSPKFSEKLYAPNGSGNYDLVDILKPWEGYFVYLDGEQQTELIIDPLNVPPTTSKVVSDLKFRLRLKAKIENLIDSDNYIGIGENFSDSYDPGDLLEPPPMGDYISLGFNNDDWEEKSGVYTTDYRKSVEPGQIWNVLITTNISNSDLVLAWENQEVLEQNYQCKLFDPANNRIIDMITDNKYSKHLPKTQNQLKVKIILGTEKFLSEKVNEFREELPKQFKLFQNYPNPFNKETLIKFYLPNSTNLIIRIYDMKGHLVKEIANELYESGFHEFIWDAVNQQDKRVASGIYVCVVKSRGLRSSKKMIFVR